MIIGTLYTIKPNEACEHTNPETGEVRKWNTQDHNYLGFETVHIIEIREEQTVSFKCQPCGHIDWDNKSKNTATKVRTDRTYVCWVDNRDFIILSEEDVYCCLGDESIYDITPPWQLGTSKLTNPAEEVHHVH